MKRASLSAAKPKRVQQIHKKKSASDTIASPSTTDTEMRPPIFQVSGFLEGRTLPETGAIFAESVMETG